jgi:hypothetical protein
MTKEEQVVGLIFQVTMWAYIAAAAAYVVIGWRHDSDLQPVLQRDVRRLVSILFCRSRLPAMGDQVTAAEVPDRFHVCFS